MLDGADRARVLRIGLGPGVVDGKPLRRRCWAVSGLLGHILISKVPYSERLRWMRSGGSLSASAELMWQLIPPRTFATNLEPPLRLGDLGAAADVPEKLRLRVANAPRR